MAKRKYAVTAIVLLLLCGGYLFFTWGISDQDIKTRRWKVGRTDCMFGIDNAPSSFRMGDLFVRFDDRTTLKDNVIYRDGQPQAVIIKRNFRGYADPEIHVLSLTTRKICIYYRKG